MDVDKLDSRILAVLDEDARLPEATIGKKVGTSKQVVRYRLNRLKERRTTPFSRFVRLTALMCPPSVT